MKRANSWRVGPFLLAMPIHYPSVIGHFYKDTLPYICRVKRFLMVMVFVWGGGFLSAQLTLSVGSPPATFRPQPTPFLSDKGRVFDSEQLLPAYARENPSGYSYLCRLELAIEEKAPIGVWVKVADRPAWKGDGLSNLQVQFKLLRF
jgi:hypothetical protein